MKMELDAKYANDRVAAERERHSAIAAAMEKRFPEGVGIYGAGFLGTWANSYLQSAGIRVTKFFDKDGRKIGGKIGGIPIAGPTADELASVPAVFIASRHAVGEVQQALAPHGLASMSFDGYFVARNFRRLIAVRDSMLTDDRSVTVFNALLMSMLTGSIAPCHDVMEKDMYFCLPEFAGNFDEAFVDAGAFVGDTVERFIWENLGTFRHIYAFEPGYRQFKAMEQRVQRLASEWAFDRDSVYLVRAGLSDSPGRMSCTFLNEAPLRHGLSDFGSEITVDEDDPASAKVLTLDSYLDGRPVSFIKADVEGMEMELLRGAQRTIRTCRPKMSLCVYHYPSHLYEVAEYVRTLVPEYRLRLRHHAPLFGDFVLYCSV
jgi:FkbM family methyltransferase